MPAEKTERATAADDAAMASASLPADMDVMPGSVGLHLPLPRAPRRQQPACRSPAHSALVWRRPSMHPQPRCANHYCIAVREGTVRLPPPFSFFPSPCAAHVAPHTPNMHLLHCRSFPRLRSWPSLSLLHPCLPPCLTFLPPRAVQHCCGANALQCPAGPVLCGPVCASAPLCLAPCCCTLHVQCVLCAALV